jgi:hypothetical protein
VIQPSTGKSKQDCEHQPGAPFPIRGKHTSCGNKRC